MRHHLPEAYCHVSMSPVDSVKQAQKDWLDSLCYQYDTCFKMAQQFSVIEKMGTKVRAVRMLIYLSTFVLYI